MDFQRLITIGFILVVTIFIASTIKILSDNQRVAKFKLGLFDMFLGPGLIIQFGRHVNEWKKVTVGDVGELIAPDTGRFPDKKDKFFDLPVEMSNLARIGSLIRITGFTENSALCIMNPDQRKTIQCEKCGHQMALS